VPDLAGILPHQAPAGRINADLNVRITMADLFTAPTAADMDRRLDLMAALSCSPDRS
jgi:hypothetical protein